jgi:hypothetical protein
MLEIKQESGFYLVLKTEIKENLKGTFKDTNVIAKVSNLETAKKILKAEKC